MSVTLLIFIFFPPLLNLKLRDLNIHIMTVPVTSPNCRVKTEKGAGKLSTLFYKQCCFWAQGGGQEEALHREAGEGERGEEKDTGLKKAACIHVDIGEKCSPGASKHFCVWSLDMFISNEYNT